MSCDIGSTNEQHRESHYPSLQWTAFGKTEIMGYLNSAPSARLVTYPISPWVNSPKHDDGARR